MQLQKKTKKRYLPLFVDNEGKIVNYLRKGKAVYFASLGATNNFLKCQPEEIKGYQETVVVEKVIMEGLPKGQKYSLVDNDKK